MPSDGGWRRRLGEHGVALVEYALLLALVAAAALSALRFMGTAVSDQLGTAGDAVAEASEAGTGGPKACGGKSEGKASEKAGEKAKKCGTKAP